MKVKMHSGCIGQEKVAIGEIEPPAPFCRCKQQIEYVKANELVKSGAASWVVTKRTPVQIEVDCKLCVGMTDIEKKTCALCHGSGRVLEGRQIPSYNNDIVLLSSVSVDPKNRKYRWNTRSKTPRVATIEKKHIIRAFVDNLKYAAARIEEYARMIQEALALFGPKNRCKLGASLIDAKTGDVIVAGNPEPPDDWHSQTGRKWDTGQPALRIVGGLKDAIEEFEERVPDKAPYPMPVNAPAATDTDSERNKFLLAYSLRKIEDGDFQDCGDSVMAAGVSWKKSELEKRAGL